MNCLNDYGMFRNAEIKHHYKLVQGQLVPGKGGFRHGIE